MFKFRKKTIIFILLIYTLLTLILTYPTVFKINTHIPGDLIAGADEDAWHDLWSFWWIKKSLTSLSNPYFTDYLYYPNGVNLAFLEMSFFNSFLSIPLQLFFNLTTIYNLLFFFHYIIAALGAYLLVYYLTKNKYASFIAGFIFAFSPYHTIHSIGNFSLQSIGWIPFFILYFIKIFDEKTIKNVVLATIFLLFISLSNLYYGIYSIIFSILFIFYVFFYNKLKLKKIPLKYLMLMFVLFFIIILPFVYPLVEEIFLGHTYIYNSPTFSIAHSADLMSFITPNWLHPLFRNLRFSIYERFTGDNFENVTFVGYLVLILVIYALIKVKKSEVRFWGISSLFFFILALGPYLHIFGKIFYLPLPGWIIQHMLFVNHMRVPSRFAVMVILSLAVLVGYGCKDILNKINNPSIKRLFVFIIFLIILFEFLAVPYPMHNTKVNEFYKQLKNDNKDYAILEMPFTFPILNKFMYYQTVHEKKLIGGGVFSRIPPYSFMENNLLLINLKDSTSHKSDIFNQNLYEIGKKILDHYNIRKVILHKKIWEENKFDYNKFKRQIEDVLKTKPEYEDDELVAYNIKEVNEFPIFMLLGDNWYQLDLLDNISVRWINNDATIKIISANNIKVKIKFEATNFYEPKNLDLYINDNFVKSYYINRWTEIKIPTLEAKEGESILKLHVKEKCKKPNRVLDNSRDSRCLNIAIREVEMSEK